MNFWRAFVLLSLFSLTTGFNCSGDPKADLAGTWVFDEEMMAKELGSEDQNNPFLSVGQGILSTIKLEVADDTITYRSLNKEKVFKLESAVYKGNMVVLKNSFNDQLQLRFTSSSTLFLKDAADAKELPMRKN